MKAIEFLKTLYKLDEIFNLVDDAEYNERQLVQFAERYHKSMMHDAVSADVLADIREFAWTDNNTGDRYVYLSQLENYLGKYFR